MPPGITTQFNPVTQIDQRQTAKLITFLRENDERYGYTNYWVSYPLAFLSQEKSGVHTCTTLSPGFSLYNQR